MTQETVVIVVTIGFMLFGMETTLSLYHHNNFMPENDQGENCEAVPHNLTEECGENCEAFSHNLPEECEHWRKRWPGIRATQEILILRLPVLICMSGIRYTDIQFDVKVYNACKQRWSVKLANSTKNTVAIPRLHSNTLYYVRVTPPVEIWMGVQQNCSKMYWACTTAKRPPALLNVLANLTNSSGIVSWTNPSPINGNITSYEVNYKFINWTYDCRESPKTNVSNTIYPKSNERSVNITGLSPAALYNISVAANITERGPWKWIIAATPAVVPVGHPINLTSTDITSSEIYISWKPPKCSETYGIINHYRINVFKGSRYVHASIASEAEDKIINLEPATNYTIYVIAVNDIGPSLFHASILLTTKGSDDKNTHMILSRSEKDYEEDLRILLMTGVDMSKKGNVVMKTEYIIGPVVAIVVFILFTILILFRIKKKRRINHFESFAMTNLWIEADDIRNVQNATDSNNRWSEDSRNSNNRVPVRKLESYFNNMLQSGRLQREYFSLKKGKQFPCLIAVAPGNILKNRYRNVLAYDHTRVVLQKWPDSYSEYINANYIDCPVEYCQSGIAGVKEPCAKGCPAVNSAEEDGQRNKAIYEQIEKNKMGYKTLRKYIATQGPMTDTINDFWKMIWQERVEKIVMATKLTEAGKVMCEKYWPDKTEKYGCILVTCKNTELFVDYIVRRFSVSKGNATRELKQFHYTGWPTRGVPSYTSSVIKYLKLIRSYEHDGRNPIIVQCSGGTGRTGTLILVDTMLDMAEEEQHVDLLQCFMNMRKQRISVIDTVDQYVFAYQVLIDALCREDTSIQCKDFGEYYDKLRLQDPSKGMTHLEIEFQKLKKLNSSVRSVAFSDTFDFFQRQTWKDWKNRNFSELSLDWRSSVRAAVYVDGYRQDNAFVVTKFPEPQTVCDFWRMIYQTSTKTIVILHSLVSEESVCDQYWPERKTEQYGEYLVTHVESEKLSSGIKVRTFNIIKRPWKNAKEIRTVKQFHLDSWFSNHVLPPSASIILKLIESVEQWQQEAGSHVVTVQCFNGACGSGVYCAAVYILEKIKVEQEVDVFEAVKCITIHKSHFVESLTQYAFLYDVAKAYLEQFSTYANFK